MPNKPLIKFGPDEETLIEVLCHRLVKSGVPVYIAVPMDEASQYTFLLEKFPNKVHIYTGSKDDPLDRMYQCAKDNNLETVVRVTHDKIFVEPELLRIALFTFSNLKPDYFYSSQFMDGTAFEIMSFKALKNAAFAYSNVEHISYAVKEHSDTIHRWEVPIPYRSEDRLLIDYPEDVHKIEKVFYKFKRHTKNKSILDILNYLRIKPGLEEINKLPVLTVYTCGYNAEEYIEECMESVAKQTIFNEIQYVLVDDGSTDKTRKLMFNFSVNNPNVTLYPCKDNHGLASASNRALEIANGKYIMRLDADDFLVKKTVLSEMVRFMRESAKDAIYPQNYHGDYNNIQSGSEQHHVGGSIFRTRAINNIKFTDGLRGYEGLDFFERAKTILDIGYVPIPTFFYRQHEESLSKNNLEEREKIRKDIYERSSKAMAKGKYI